MKLKTFDVVIEGTRSQEKAHSLRDLLAQFDMMGIEKRDIKVIGEVDATGNTTSIKQPPAVDPSQLTAQERGSGSIPMINLDDVPENMRESVAKELRENAKNASEKETLPRRMESGTKPFIPQNISVKIWKDGDTEYKLENNKLYKREWTKTNLKGLEANGIRIRIKDQDDIKLKAKEYTIEIQDWQEIQQS